MLSALDLDAIDLPSLAFSLREHVEANALTIASIAAIDVPRGFRGTREARDHIVARAADLARVGHVLALMARHEGLSESFLARLVAMEAPKPTPRLVASSAPPRGRLLKRIAALMPWRFPSAAEPARSTEPMQAAA